MGFMDDLRRLLTREGKEAKRWVDEAVGDADAALDRAERRIDEDPSVRMDATLDDIEASDAAFDAVRERAEGRSVAPAAAAEVEGPGEGEDRVVFSPASVPGGPGEVEPDLPPRDGMGMARLWVSVAAPDPDDPLAAEGYVQLWIDEVAGRVVGDDWFEQEFPATVEALREVEGVVHEDREVLWVRGPGLTAEAARLLVAEVLAPRISTDWEDRLG